MKKLSCKNGDQFGNWTVIDNTPVIKSGHTYVQVECKCGKQQLSCLSDLNNGRTKGCRKCGVESRRTKINIGDKYKSWTVIGNPKKNSNNSLVYEVQCDCGTTKWVQANELVDLTRNFECVKCAAKSRSEKITEENGRVGELTLTRYTKLKSSSEKRNIEFSVELSYLWDLFINQERKCAITGDILESIQESSLDRIDSNKGYIKGNVQWTTVQANLSKHIMTTEELLTFCNKVIKHANQQPSTPLTKCEGSETNSWNCKIKPGDGILKQINDFRNQEPKTFKKLTLKMLNEVLAEYNTNTSAEHPEMDDDIVRYSLKEESIE